MFAALAILGALIALAVPASSMAVMTPAGAKFEIVGNQFGPKIETSLGSCLITKISGQIPSASPQPASFGVSTPTVGQCTSGTSLTLGGEWKAYTSYGTTVLPVSTNSPGAFTMRFSSLPGCKLIPAGEGVAFWDVWSNGSSVYSVGKAPEKSAITFLSGGSGVWANDGSSSCALAGTPEPFSTTDTSGEFEKRNLFPRPATVVNVGSPNTPIILIP
jgi:hypothetical protein